MRKFAQSRRCPDLSDVFCPAHLSLHWFIHRAELLRGVGWEVSSSKTIKDPSIDLIKRLFRNSLFSSYRITQPHVTSALIFQLDIRLVKISLSTEIFRLPNMSTHKFQQCQVEVQSLMSLTSSVSKVVHFSVPSGRQGAPLEGKGSVSVRLPSSGHFLEGKDTTSEHLRYSPTHIPILSLEQRGEFHLASS